VQTANAAATRTAQALPSHTPTATWTPTPRNTETPEPTSTRPFVFILPGSTSSLSAPTLAGINNGSSNSNYACTIFSTEPANNTVFAPRTDFVASWGVKNIGKKDWFRATMDYVYVSGDKLHEVSSYDLPKGVERGKNVFLPVEMATFKNPGTYTTTWALAVENIYFCKLTLTIIVQ
jgi:Ig-like domain from next to BRCA1 gene